MDKVIVLGRSYNCIIDRRDIKKVYIQYKDNSIVFKCPKRMKDNEIRIFSHNLHINKLKVD